ncbi:MAG: hypothetical protein PHN63_04745, partial [Candidatus Omnitrophica bacterium]|nr:hypothetical protein [Candidatus Omnitrophota bacterium]
MDEITNANTYQKGLFEKLRKSVSLKKEEECIACLIKPAAWWTIEKPNPKLADLKKLVSCSCPHYKASSAGKDTGCIKIIYKVIQKARETKALTKFACVHNLHGFIYPIMNEGTLYGYIGSCYKKRDVTPEVLEIFATFTDTLVREIQKELELAKLYETVRPRAIALSTVHTVHRLISSTLDLTELIPRIARLSLQIMRANRCSIKLVDSKRKILLPKATVDLRKKNVMLKKVKVGRHAPGRAFKYGRPIRGRDYL